jgi:hypothetical protein
MKSYLSFLAAICCAGALSAQTVVLTEDFNANVVPPVGWTTQNVNGNTLNVGWTTDMAGQAYHWDELGAGLCDDILATPVMDLSALTQAYVHFDTTMAWVSYLDAQSLDVSTDGGLTWVLVWSDLGFNTGLVTVDLAAYVGNASVMLGFHYVGDYAHAVGVDNVTVSDSSSPPPPPGVQFVVNLPTTFAALPLLEDFSTGTVPSHMALTANNEFDLPDLEAHCSVANGQLEMGLDPLSVNYHVVRNAMVLGVDGSTMAGSMLDFDMTDHGEEAHPQDGVFVSSDGVNWQSTTVGVWVGQTEEVDVDLSCGGLVDISGTFYVMIGQSDNFPYAYLDGIDVDNLNIDDQVGHGGHTGGGGLVYAVTPMTAGAPVTFSVTGAVPSSTVILGYSLNGAGPINTAYGVVDMTPPIKTLATLVSDPLGVATLTLTVPGNAAGVTLYTQGLNNGLLTNSLAELVN